MIDLKKRILILDGGLGTMIQRAHLSEADFRGNRFADWGCDLKGCNDLLVLTHSDVIADIHREYLDAGADIIETNSFNANAISLADYGLQDYVYEINSAAARLARSVVDEWCSRHNGAKRYVAGSIGPTNRSLSMSPSVEDAAERNVTWRELTATYQTQIQGLIDGGVDCLLIETVFDTLNAKAALWAADEAMGICGKRVPIMLSVTLTESGRTLSGQTLEAMLTSVAHASLASVGLNCGFGAEGMAQWIEQLAALTALPVSVYPNAGLPNEMGEYDETPEKMVMHVRPMLEKGLVNVIGGCCGTTPEHIRAIANLAKKYAPRIPKPLPDVMRLSGYEGMTVTPERNFVNIGERCNVAGSRKFLRLINEKNYDEAIAIARKQVDDGAQIVDVNMDDAMLDSVAEMSHFLRLLAAEPDVARVPVMIDSSNWDVITAGLECLQGKSIVNSISLKDGEETFIRKAEYVKRMGATVVVMAFDENGQADTYERKIAVCERSYKILTSRVAFNPQDIIFDPNVLAIATGLEEHNNYAIDFIRAVDWIKHNLPGAKVSGGLSNLSFALRGNNYVREAMHSVFLYHAIGKGLDMAIVNAGAIMPYDDVPADLRKAIEDVIFNTDEDATSRLISLAEALKNDGVTLKSKDNIADELAAMNPYDRLKTMLVRGITDNIETLLNENYKALGSAVAVIDGPLMAGMNEVGELFGAGKLFLPQVVKSARTMKQAVAWLNPLIEADRTREGGGKKQGKMVIATVKGDVHDIGKNIVNVIMRCNGFEVIDLGVMVPAEEIVKRAEDEKADLIAASGLITPSLEEMRRLAALMQKHKLTIPLMVGGATTSELHTAVKIAPEYDGPVVYTRDAAMMPVVAQQLLTDRDQFMQSWRQRQQQLRDDHNKRQPILTIEAARKLKPHLGYSPAKPAVLGIQKVEINLEDACRYINWIPFLAAWHISRNSAEARRLLAEAQAELDAMTADGCAVNAEFGLWQAYSDGDDILIDGGRVTIPTLRQQRKSNSGEQLALSDYIAPKDSGITDYIGTFAVTVNEGLVKRINEAKGADDDYTMILRQTLSDRIVEAATELLHQQIRRKYWGYSTDEDDNPKNLLRQYYRGIRPAVGYPSLPDQSIIFDIDHLMPLAEIGISLTENGAMIPASSVCGLVFSHPDSHYFMVGTVGDDQRADYASRRNMDVSKWLAK